MLLGSGESDRAGSGYHSIRRIPRPSRTEDCTEYRSSAMKRLPSHEQLKVSLPYGSNYHRP